MRNRVAEKVATLAAEQAAQAASVQDSPPEYLSSPKESRSLGIARGGLGTGFDVINLLTATITDTLEEAITTSQAGVVVNAVGKVLKVVELQFKYGKPRPGFAHERDLVLVANVQQQSPS